MTMSRCKFRFGRAEPRRGTRGDREDADPTKRKLSYECTSHAYLFKFACAEPNHAEARGGGPGRRQPDQAKTCWQLCCRNSLLLPLTILRGLHVLHVALELILIDLAVAVLVHFVELGFPRGASAFLR